MLRGWTTRAVESSTARFGAVLACILLALSAAAGSAQEPAGAAGAAPAPQGPATEPVAQLEAEPLSAHPWGPDEAETGSVEAIRRFTTAEELLPRSVAYLPEDPAVPSPTEVLGHLVGAPDELSHVAQVHGYFRTLAATSPRVRVEVAGTSEEGREILLAAVSSQENLANLSRLSEITAALADPRRTSRQAMEALAEEGKVLYYLVGGLHSTETGSPEMLMELAYRLAVSERPEIRRIRDEVVVLITPVAEPDGRERVVDWYYRHLRGRDMPWEELREILSPPYWGSYVFHDNNRDGMQRALALTRALQGVFHTLHPQVMHDLHESVPLLYISTGHGPYSEAVDPVTVNEWTQLAHYEAGALQAQGLPGVWVWGFWDGWWPGYLVSVANNHNAVGRFYETFGNGSAGTFERDLADARYAGKEVTEKQWYRPWPPAETLRWSLRNNTNYMQAGVLKALEYASLHGRDLLANGWIKAERAVRRGRSEAPYAWIFPLDQRDPRRLDYLVNQLLAHGIEVHRASSEIVLEGESYPPGTYVVRLDQPYRGAAINFLKAQDFPADEPNPPYDDVAWTWPLLYGVEGRQVDQASILEAAMEPVGGAVHTEGGVEGIGDEIFFVRDLGQTSLLQARLLLDRYQVDAAEESFEVGGREYPMGSWIVLAPRSVVEQVGRLLGLTFEASLMLPEARRHVVDLPRLGVFHTWTSTQDAGWVRYTLDQEQIPYQLLSPEDLKRGDLAARVDVLLLPQSRGDFKRMVHGLDPSLGPLAYTRTPEFPSHGTPDASPDITGGMGFTGLEELDRFMRQGGVVVALGNAGTLLVDGGLVRRVSRADVGPRSTPGSEVQARFLRAGHPIGYGYEEIASVFRGNGPVWEVPKRDHGKVVMQFGARLSEDDAKAGGSVLARPSPLDEEEMQLEDVAVGAEGAGEGAAEGGGATRLEVVEEEDLTEGETAPAEGEEGEGAAGEEAVAAPSGQSPAEPDLGPLVLAGHVDDEKALAGKPAILDLAVGDGRVILFAFNPLHRYLNHSDFRLVWNVILNWNDLP